MGNDKAMKGKNAGAEPATAGKGAAKATKAGDKTPAAKPAPVKAETAKK
jgi:hypothetical protein